MYKRIGKCKVDGKCCKSFNLFAGAMSDFKRAGIQLFRNPDGTYRCSMIEGNLCKIQKNKPKACKRAPQAPFPWTCGYKFIEIKQPRKEKRATRKAIHLLEEIDPKKGMNDETREILECGRDYLGSVIYRTL